MKSDQSAKGSFLLNTESVNGKKVHLPVRIFPSQKTTVYLDEKVELKGRAVASREVRAAALIFAEEIKTLRDPKPIFQISERIRSRFRSEASRIGGDAGALIPGLVIGDTKNESKTFTDQMRRVGLTHLTAVSGENFAIVAAFLAWLLQFFIPKLRLRLVITGLVLVLFIFLVRPSPSVIRASVMTAIALISLGRGIKVNALASLGVAISLILLIDPFQAIDPGFALSVGATAGIILLAPNLKLPEPIAIPIAATLFCTPVIIALSGTLSLISIPANILVSPLVAPITVIGLVAALIPLIAHPLLLLISPLARLLTAVAHFGARVPVLSLPKSFVGAALVLGVIFLIHWKKKFAALVFALSLLSLSLIHGNFPGANWEVVNCDVGQGDGMVLNLGNRSAIVIDTGPDPVVIDKCLRSLKIRDIPLLILTHFHQDHVGGLSGVLDGRRVEKVWLTAFAQPFLEYEVVFKELMNVPKFFPTKGYTTAFDSAKGRVKIEVLWPEPNYYGSAGSRGTVINNSSLATLITINKLTIFASGDIEPESASAVFAENRVKDIDILKVPHHGSAYQFAPLLQAAHPKISLISVGRANRYGHPAPNTIALLRRIGSKVIRTDQDGAISVDPSLIIRTKRKDWWDISWG